MAMTLQEMLDLLPDNDTGAITASDMRTIVTGLMENVDETNTAVGENADAITAAEGRLDDHETRLDTLEA